jgi:hypothetical protein
MSIVIACIIVMALAFWLLPTDNEQGADLGVILGNVSDESRDE